MFLSLLHFFMSYFLILPFKPTPHHPAACTEYNNAFALRLRPSVSVGDGKLIIFISISTSVG